MGSVSLARAVQKSSNVATYRLYQELGPENCLEYLEEMNFKGLTKEDYEYDTTCLGGFTKGATVVEMAASYATLCDDGEYRDPTCIVRITDSEGNIVVPDEQIEKRIYSTNAARMMTDVLESCVKVSSATASGCKLEGGMPAACKTGTTTDYVDGWLCGYTPYYTTAVWVGMDVYKSVDDLKGNTYPAYIWKNYMDKVHQGLEVIDFDSSLDEEEAMVEPATTEATTEEDDSEDEDEKTPHQYKQDDEDDEDEDEDEDQNSYEDQENKEDQENDSDEDDENGINNNDNDNENKNENENEGLFDGFI
jgi:membrane peptidoglycan carboxypeptidase